MATMIDGESYVGRVLMRPLSPSGDLRLYLWPLRCLKSHMGGPTFGIEVKGEEILRFDAHGPRGHWHKGGYDKLGAGGSHQDFPEGVGDTASQLSWSLGYLRAQTPPRHPLRQCIIKLTGYSRGKSPLGRRPLLPYARPGYYSM